MDPTITAAWISGDVGALGIVSTTVTAWIGSRNTRKATEATIAGSISTTAATLAAAREERMWDKRCAAYEETVAGLLYRREKRQQDYVQTFQGEEAGSERELKDFFAGYEPPGWVDARARLASYASDAVLAASEGSERADYILWRLYQRWLVAFEDNKRASESGHPAGMPDDDALYMTRRALATGITEAGTQDQALIKIIREELRTKPEAAIAPPALPAVRRRRWPRRRE